MVAGLSDQVKHSIWQLANFFRRYQIVINFLMHTNLSSLLLLDCIDERRKVEINAAMS
jgi:hypothetical protein